MYVVEELRFDHVLTIQRLVGKELIETTILELLEEKSIEQISVAEIAENSGISTRAFYNHFCDKHEAVGAISLRYMKPFVDCPLDEWYTHMSDFFRLIRDTWKTRCVIPAKTIWAKEIHPLLFFVPVEFSAGSCWSEKVLLRFTTRKQVVL